MSSKNPMTSKRHTVSMYPASSTSCCSIVMFPSRMSPVFSIFKGVQVVSSSQARDSHMSYRMSLLSGTGARRLALKLDGLSTGILWTRVNRAICDTACDTENFTGTRQSPNVKTHFGNHRTHVALPSAMTSMNRRRTADKFVGHEILLCVHVPVRELRCVDDMERTVDPRICAGRCNIVPRHSLKVVQRRVHHNGSVANPASLRPTFRALYQRIVVTMVQIVGSGDVKIVRHARDFVLW